MIKLILKPRISIPWMTLVLISIFAVSGFANTAKKAEQKVGKSIDTRQETQKATQEWDGKKAELQALYDQLLGKNEALNAAHEELSEQKIKHADLNQTLIQQKKENQQIEKEMMPFLRSVYKNLEHLVQSSAPFLLQERTKRLQKLENVMQDIDISIAEKYRKVMEALAVEAEYGNTIEVYQEKINLENSEVLGNIFRLGRISLFFLSLDKKSSAVFNVAQERWVTLDNDYISAIDKCLQMVAKHRPVELIALPLGQLDQAQSLKRGVQ